MPAAQQSTPELRHAYADLGDVRLHYVIGGSGPLMLFVHGFPEFWLAWKHQLAHFAKSHTVVAFDTRGYNLSSKPERVEDYRPKKLMQDVVGMIAHLGFEKCVLVAHDWGGAVAWSVAIAHPECIDKLVIVNATHPIPFARDLVRSDAQRAASQYMLTLRSPNAEHELSANDFAFLFATLAKSTRPGGALDDEEKAAYHAAWSQPGAITGAVNYYRASPLYPPSATDPGAAKLVLDPEMFRVRVPTLVIWGEQDHALLLPLLDGLEHVVDDLRIERVADASHWVMHEVPDTVNALIEDYLKG